MVSQLHALPDLKYSILTRIDSQPQPQSLSEPSALVLRLKWGRQTLFLPVVPSTTIASVRTSFVDAVKPDADEVGLFIRADDGVFMPIHDGTVQSAALKDSDVVCVGFKAPGARTSISQPLPTPPHTTRI